MTPEEAKVAKEEAAITKKDEGNTAFKEHRYHTAIKLYTESLKLVPNHLVYGNRAQTYIHLELYELALRDLNEALEMNPSFMKNTNRRSKVLSHLGMNTEARLDNEAILRRCPKDKNALTESEALKGKENARYMDVKQWNSGYEFEDDEMIAITIDGLEPPSDSETTDSSTESDPLATDPEVDEDTVTPAADAPVEDTVSIEKEPEDKVTVIPELAEAKAGDHSEEDTVSIEKEPEDKVSGLLVNTEAEAVAHSEEDTVSIEKEPVATPVVEDTVLPVDTVADELPSSEEDAVPATVVIEDTVTIKKEEPEEEEITVLPVDTVPEAVAKSEEDTVANGTAEEEEDTVSTPATTVLVTSPAMSMSDETFVSAPEATDRTDSNVSCENVKDESFSSISDLHSMTGDPANGYTTPDDSIDEEKKEQKGEEQPKQDLLSNDEETGDGDTTAPTEAMLMRQVEKEGEEDTVAEQQHTVLDLTTVAKEKVEETVPEEVKDEEDTVSEQQSTVLDLTTVAKKEVDDTVSEEVKDEDTTVLDQQTPTVPEVKEEKKEKEEEEATVAVHQTPIAIPPPAKNFDDFYHHYNQLKHDSEAFGKYFLSIDPDSLFNVFSNLLDSDHLNAIVAGLSVAANADVADLSLISSTLFAVSSLPRFDIVVLFMNNDERSRACSLIDLLPSTEEREQIRKNFQ